jgi:hypothetical protein
MPTNGSGITSADTKFQKLKQIPIQLKRTMLNSVTTWHAWLANHVVFLVVLMHWNVLYVYLSSVSTADNFTSNIFQSVLRM